MKIPKVGIIGAGKFGEVHLKALSQMHRRGQAQLAAVAEINEKLLEQRLREYGEGVLPRTARFTDYRRMLEGCPLDAVTIATPDHLHRDIALDCLAAGKHVLVEKPMDVTVAGCRQMVEAAASRNLLLQVDFHKRYDPYHRELEAAVASGKLGGIQYGYAHVEDRIEVPRDWFPNWAPKSSPVWFLGVHMIDLIRWVIKSDGAEVCATGTKEKLASLGVDTYDSIQCTILFRSGASFTVHSAWMLPDKFEAVVDQGIRVVGSEGVMEVDSQYRGSRACFAQSGMVTHNLGFMQDRRDADGRPAWAGYGIEAIEDFAQNVARILGGGPKRIAGSPTPSGEDGLAVTAIAVAAHESLASRKAVAVAAAGGRAGENRE
jgi:predicted dehydrogenase